MGAILTLGMNESTVGQGVMLLASYSLGLGIPFLLTGRAVDRATTLLRRARRYMPAIKMATAVLLIVVGVSAVAWGIHWSIVSGDMKNTVLLFGGSLFFQGLTSVLGIESNS